MNTIKQFCEERKLTNPIQEAFIVYVRSTYAERFMLSMGDTVQMIVNKMTRQQVEEAWLEFVREIKNEVFD